LLFISPRKQFYWLMWQVKVLANLF
jgi:hypothetical protein